MNVPMTSPLSFKKIPCDRHSSPPSKTKSSLAALAALAVFLRFTLPKQTKLLPQLTMTSTLSHGLPTAIPAKFAVQITADLGTGPQSFYLSKDRLGGSVPSLSLAAPCTITPRSYLSCDNRSMGASSSNRAIPEIAPIVATGDPGAIGDGYSVDESHTLHWRSTKFPAKVMKSKSEGGQDGEAIFGMARGSDGKVLLVQLLGFDGKSGNATRFEKVVAGVAKVVPLV